MRIIIMILIVGMVLISGCSELSELYGIQPAQEGYLTMEETRIEVNVSVVEAECEDIVNTNEFDYSCWQIEKMIMLDLDVPIEEVITTRFCDGMFIIKDVVKISSRDEWQALKGEFAERCLGDLE